jgi:uncharacterized protein (UPF0297 family)
MSPHTICKSNVHTNRMCNFLNYMSAVYMNSQAKKAYTAVSQLTGYVLNNFHLNKIPSRSGQIIWLCCYSRDCAANSLVQEVWSSNPGVGKLYILRLSSLIGRISRKYYMR